MQELQEVIYQHEESLRQLQGDVGRGKEAIFRSIAVHARTAQQSFKSQGRTLIGLGEQQSR